MTTPLRQTGTAMLAGDLAFRPYRIISGCVLGGVSAPSLSAAASREADGCRPWDPGSVEVCWPAICWAACAWEVKNFPARHNSHAHADDGATYAA